MDKLDYLKRLHKQGEKIENLEIIEPPTKQAEILKDPNLFKRITEVEFDKRITGELPSRKAIFLSLCSIWVKDMEIPLNTIVSSESSSGKSYICKQIIKIFPTYLVCYRSKITGEAFTYWHNNEEDWTWEGKILYLEDISQTVLDSCTFKVMCSDGSIATVVKNQRAIDLYVNGKPCLLVTTATTNPTMEILNRFSIVQMDESSRQTQDITWMQALDQKKEPFDQEVIDALSYLERKNVSVPFAPLIHTYLTKNYSWEDLRMRRDFPRLISLIKCSAVLHQYQREKNDKGEIIAIQKDYEIARECINYIQTNTLKGLTHKLKKAYDFCLVEKEFNAKEISTRHPFVNQAMWYRYLSELCERKLLTSERRVVDGSDKQVTYFKISETPHFNLPDYEKLSENSIIRINSIIAEGNSTNSTNSTEIPQEIDYSKIKPVKPEDAFNSNN